MLLDQWGEKRGNYGPARAHRSSAGAAAGELSPSGSASLDMVNLCVKLPTNVDSAFPEFDFRRLLANGF